MVAQRTRPGVAGIVPHVQTPLVPTTAQVTPKKNPAGLVTEATFWLMVLSILGVVLLLALLSYRRRRRKLELLKSQPRPPSPPIPDAWAESARRLTLPPESESLSDTRTLPSIRPGPSSAEGRPLVLITGGARRVGRAIALEFARRGCDILVTYNTSEAEAKSLAAQAADLGAGCEIIPLDLAAPGGIRAFARSLREATPRLDVLVHNASVYAPSHLETEELSPQRILDDYTINAGAPLLLTALLRECLQASILPGGGSVVAMCDIHAMGRPRRGFVSYAMSKAALSEMVRTLARDLAPAIRVNGVAPGVVAWPESGYEAEESEQAKYLRRVPLGRAGTPEEAAQVVRWLALEATYVTGQIIRVDGGRWLT